MGGDLSDAAVYQLPVLHAEELGQNDITNRDLHADELGQNDIANRNRLITRGGFSLKLLTDIKCIIVDHIGTLDEDAQANVATARSV